MKRILLGLALLLASIAPAHAQQSAAAETVVATVNGETITRAQLDRLWNRMSEKMRAQYEKTGGGKRGFLDNYIRKRLLLQKAQAAGFDKSPDVQAELEAAREAALFDLYIRDVVASPIVNEAAIRRFYEEHPDDFVRDERAKVRLILVATANRSAEEARAKTAEAMKDLFTVKMSAPNDPKKLAEAFAAAARKYSDHPSAADGGDLGWVDRNGLEKPVADAAFAMKPGSMTGIIEAEDGMHLIFLEDLQPGVVESYESARAGIREFLLGQNAQKVVEAVNRTTSELVKSSKVVVYADNVD